MVKKKFVIRYYEDEDNEYVPESVVHATIKEIIAVVHKYLSSSPRTWNVLDIGSGNGAYSFGLEQYVKKVVGVEPFPIAYKKALLKKGGRDSRTIFYNVPVELLKTRIKFDLAIALTVIEHMPHAERSFKRVLELLKPGGVIYLTAPNKLWPFEPHYRLLFLNYLPLPLANLYVRLSGRGRSFKDSSYARTYFGMKKLFNKYNCHYYFMLPLQTDSSYLGYGTGGILFRWIRRLGIALIKRFPILWIISKGFIILVIKNE